MIWIVNISAIIYEHTIARWLLFQWVPRLPCKIVKVRIVSEYTVQSIIVQDPNV